MELACQVWSISLELFKNVGELGLARVLLGVLELLSLIPVAAEVAIDLELRTVVFQMLVDALESLDGLAAGDTDYLHALALVENVALEVLQEHALLDLVLVAPVEHLDLAKHLAQELVLDLLEDGLGHGLPGAHLGLVLFRLSDL